MIERCKSWLKHRRGAMYSTPPPIFGHQCGAGASAQFDRIREALSGATQPGHDVTSAVMPQLVSNGSFNGVPSTYNSARSRAADPNK